MDSGASADVARCIYPGTVAKSRLHFLDGNTRSFLVSGQNDGRAGGAHPSEGGYFITHQMTEFGGIRYPDFDQERIFAGNVMHFLHLHQ